MTEMFLLVRIGTDACRHHDDVLKVHASSYPIIPYHPLPPRQIIQKLRPVDCAIGPRCLVAGTAMRVLDIHLPIVERELAQVDVWLKAIK
jgi:hypothetical protein